MVDLITLTYLGGKSGIWLEPTKVYLYLRYLTKQVLPPYPFQPEQPINLDPEDFEKKLQL